MQAAAVRILPPIYILLFICFYLIMRDYELVYKNRKQSHFLSFLQLLPDKCYVEHKEVQNMSRHRSCKRFQMETKMGKMIEPQLPTRLERHQADTQTLTCSCSQSSALRPSCLRCPTDEIAA